MARVVIEHLTKAFKASRREVITAVHDLNLAIESGELLALVGPSGSGKSTTLRLLAGLEQPSEGSKISIDGVDVTNTPARNRDVAMVFQHHALHPHMTVFENLAFPLTIRKIQRAETDRRVHEMADVLDLSDCLDRLPAQVSGGQRQRVALGRALVRRPKVLLLDEPLSNLDTQLRAQMRRLIARINSTLGCTMVYVTHDQIEAMMLGKRIAVMDRGLLQQAGEPREIYRRPGNTFVAAFFGWPPMNLVPGNIVQRENKFFFEEQGANGRPGLKLRLGSSGSANLQTAAGQQVVLGIRPEDVLSETPGGESIQALVDTIEPAGAATFIHLDAGSHTLVASVSGNQTVRLQERRNFRLDPDRIHLFDAATGKRLTSAPDPA